MGMLISGFSFVRNGVKLYYPVEESIRSILPIVEEFVIAVGKGDPDDETREVIAGIGDPKIRIIDTVWDERFFEKGAINAIQTDIAKTACSGSWLFYLQADEVVHEKDLALIRRRCEVLLDNERVEGFLFRYLHFWGDYEHVHRGHGWYPREVRIIRNRADIHSFESAQSFRVFDTYTHPRQQGGTRKLRVAAADAEIYHYGWVRPPRLMQTKKRAFHTIHWGPGRAKRVYDQAPAVFDYGPLNRLPVFRDKHPLVMEKRIAAMDWKAELQYQGRPDPAREKHKHEKFKYRFLTLLERCLTGGREIGGFKNYDLLKHL